MMSNVRVDAGVLTILERSPYNTHKRLFSIVHLKVDTGNAYNYAVA